MGILMNLEERSKKSLLKKISWFYFFLNKEIINSKATAPTTAQIMLPKIDVVVIPSKSNINPPTNPPTIPIKRLYKKPKPLPFISNPAIYPASAPTKIETIIPI